MRTHLNRTREDWKVWTEWYDDRLAGRPMNPDLESEMVLIPDDVWEQGPKALNAEIRRLIDKYNGEQREETSVDQMIASTPQAEQIIIDTSTGLIGIEPKPVKPGGAHGNACQKIADRLDDLRPRLPENQFTALEPVVSDLDRTTARYAEYPRRVHDDFETAVVNIQSLLDRTEIADDLLISNLISDLETGVIGIRAENPEIEKLAMGARAKLRLQRLSPDDRQELVRITEKASEITDPLLGEQLKEDATTLADAPAEQSADPLPEGAERTAGYRLGGRLLRIFRSSTDRDALKERFGKTVGAADKIDKLAKGGGWIGAGIQAIRTLLGF